MKYCTILVLYIGKRFSVEYHNNLMICGVYIIYIIVIRDSTYIIKIMKGVMTIMFLCTIMIITEKQKCCHYKIKDIDNGCDDYSL